MGLIEPEGFADGAATGPLNISRSLRATGCAGTRIAIVSNPAVISSDKFDPALIGATIVSGPGQNYLRAIKHRHQDIQISVLFLNL